MLLMNMGNRMEKITVSRQEHCRAALSLSENIRIWQSLAARPPQIENLTPPPRMQTPDSPRGGWQTLERPQHPPE